MPLNFLDHHIKQGNSLIGATRVLVAVGIPDDAYKPVTGDDKKVASEIKKRNKAERERYLSGYDQRSLFEAPTNDGGAALADALRQLDDMNAGTVAEVRAKANRYQQVRTDAEAEFTHFNLWTAAFFEPLTPQTAPYIPTTQTLADYERNPRAVGADIIGAANGLAAEAGFFHWELEFPQAFDQANAPSAKARRAKDDISSPFGDGGFDVVLGNPPWEQIELKEEEHWVDVQVIANAQNKAARDKLIREWRLGNETQRVRIAGFDAAKYRPEAESRFVRSSNRYLLTATGRANTYALFTEHVRSLLSARGRAGIIVPTGIATDDTTKAFFIDLVDSGTLVSLKGFENEEFIFPGIANVVRFCMLAISGKNLFATNFTLAYYMRRIDQLQEEIRFFSLKKS